jgi:hypothetical protein
MESTESAIANRHVISGQGTANAGKSALVPAIPTLARGTPAFGAERPAVKQGTGQDDARFVVASGGYRLGEIASRGRASAA